MVPFPQHVSPCQFKTHILEGKANNYMLDWDSTITLDLIVHAWLGFGNIFSFYILDVDVLKKEFENIYVLGVDKF